MSKRKREKCSKGLRHFSMKVCEKVKQKGTTTYNQVADELVNEYCVNSVLPTAMTAGTASNDCWTHDQKNVRRRVYDALNVLMAMGIISKEKKEIKWIGLPYNRKQECADLEADKKRREERVEAKSELLKSLLTEQVLIKSLVERNKTLDGGEQKLDTKDTVKLKPPFIALNTGIKTQIDCNVSSNRKEYSIQLDNAFELSSHLDVIKRLGFMDVFEKEDKNENEVKKIADLVPELFKPYINQLKEGDKLEPICFLPIVPSFKIDGQKSSGQEKKWPHPNNKPSSLRIKFKKHGERDSDERRATKEMDECSSSCGGSRGGNEAGSKGVAGNNDEYYGDEEEDDDDDEEDDEEDDEDEEEDEEDDDDEEDEDDYYEDDEYDEFENSASGRDGDAMDANDETSSSNRT